MSAENLIEEVQRRAAGDPELRRSLVADPRGTIERITGARFPESLSVQVLEPGPDELYLVLPPEESEMLELSDRELDQVAGAGCGWCMFTDGTWCWFTK